MTGLLYRNKEEKNPNLSKRVEIIGSILNLNYAYEEKKSVSIQADSANLFKIVRLGSY